jgi:hypothetical protein
MEQRNNARRLLQTLERIAAISQSQDARLLQEMKKCTSSRAACSILTGGLNCNASNNRDELLLPVASWIYPLV